MKKVKTGKYKECVQFKDLDFGAYFNLQGGKRWYIKLKCKDSDTVGADLITGQVREFYPSDMCVVN